MNTEKENSIADRINYFFSWRGDGCLFIMGIISLLFWLSILGLGIYGIIKKEYSIGTAIIVFCSLIVWLSCSVIKDAFIKWKETKNDYLPDAKQNEEDN